MMKHKILTLAFAIILAGTTTGIAQMPPMPHGRPHPTPEAIEAKLAEQLNLTDAQKEQVKIRREADRQEIKQLMDQMKEIRNRMDQIRQANMADFEAILTPEQQAQFAKIKAERKARHMEMKKHRPMMRPHPTTTSESEQPASQPVQTENTPAEQQ